jgi:hypothetical protein
MGRRVRVFSDFFKTIGQGFIFFTDFFIGKDLTVDRKAEKEE